MSTMFSDDVPTSADGHDYLLLVSFRVGHFGLIQPGKVDNQTHNPLRQLDVMLITVKHESCFDRGVCPARGNPKNIGISTLWGLQVVRTIQTLVQ